MSDFRVTEFESPLGDIKAKKDIFLNEVFRKKHPRTQKHYDYVSKAEIKAGFGRLVYNEKCAYCGVTVDIQGVDNFEIDHFLNEAHNEGWDGVNKVPNLIYSCRECNRQKGDFDIPPSHAGKLDPDSSEYATLFERNDSFGICVSDDYADDSVVTGFYDRLMLWHARKSLDYMLMVLDGWLKANKGRQDVLYLDLLNVYHEMLNKRNHIVFSRTSAGQRK